MQEALDLAIKGYPEVFPNPLVGAVIVKDAEIVARGYHRCFGAAHAEVEAIRNLPETINPADCKLYVTLEPCSHHGKTPPCTDLIIRSGFKKVIVACKDPNPLIAGQGIEMLRNAGVEVDCGLLQTEARYLNRKFMVFHEQKRPYIILKWAQSADGFISRLPVPADRSKNGISGPEALRFTHELRAGVMGILVGKNTVLSDNPTLTTRLVKGKNPVRFIIDKNLEVPANFNVFNAEAITHVFNAKNEEEKGHIRFKKLDFKVDVLPQICDILYSMQVQSILVEGGQHTLERFIESPYWDECYQIINPKLELKNGLKAPNFKLSKDFADLGGDICYSTNRFK